MTAQRAYVTIKVSFKTLHTKHARKDDDMIDIALLEYAMKKNGVSKGDMCAALNISRSAFYRKCKGDREFTLREIRKIVDFLNLESPIPIFFNQEVSYRLQITS